MELTLEKGRPASADGRAEKELRVYELLDALGMEYERIDHDAVMTMELCRDIDDALGAEICKNLFLCNRQKTQFYLLMLAGDKTFHTKELSAQIGSARLSFADASFMEAFLDITPGSVSVMGLMNDVGCHPCVNTSSLKLRTQEVFGLFLEAVHHDMTTVRLG